MRDTRELTRAFDLTGLPVGPMSRTRRLWSAGAGQRYRLHATAYCKHSPNMALYDVSFDDPREGCRKCGVDKLPDHSEPWARAVIWAADASRTMDRLEQLGASADTEALARTRAGVEMLERGLNQHIAALALVASTARGEFGYAACVAAFDDHAETIRARLRYIEASAVANATRWAAGVAADLPAVLAVDLATDTVERATRADGPGQWGKTLAGVAVTAIRAWSQTLGGSTTADALSDSPMSHTTRSAADADDALRRVVGEARVPLDRDQYPGPWRTTVDPTMNPFDAIEAEWACRQVEVADDLLAALETARAEFAAQAAVPAVVAVDGKLPVHRGGAIIATAPRLAVDVEHPEVRFVARMTALEAAWLQAWAHRRVGFDSTPLTLHVLATGDDTDGGIGEEVAATFLRLWTPRVSGEFRDPAATLAVAISLTA